jgi:ribonuclease HI
MAKQKWYVVLKGRKPGIYDLWDEAKEQVHGFPGPVFRSFESQNEAEKAWSEGRFPANPPNSGTQFPSPKKAGKKSVSFPAGQFLVVDAACSGVPGPAEYQGFLMPEKQLLFHKKIGWATNNLGEFLGIVHAIAFLQKNGSDLPVYSDSATAISWVKKKMVKSNLLRNQKTEEAWQLVDRALVWLRENQYRNRIEKWETEQWGENPADFGRK